MKKAKKKFFFIFALILLVGGIFAFREYFGNFRTRWTLLKILEASEKVASFSFAATSQLKKSDARDAWDVAMNMEGDYARDTRGQKLASSIKLDIQSPYEAYNIKGMDIHAVYTDANSVFLQFKNFPKLPFVDFTPILGAWIQFTSPPVSSNKAPVNWPSVASEHFKEIVKYKDELIVSYVKNEFFSFQALPDENISGTPSRHYTLALDTKKYNKFVEYFFNTAEKTNVNGAPSADRENLKQYFDAISKLLASFNVSGEFWVGKKDSLIRKVNLMVKSIGPGAPEQTLALSIRFDNYNRSFQIEIPGNFITLDDAFVKITGKDLKKVNFFKKSLSLLTQKKPQNIVNSDTDSDGLPDFMEKVLKTDPLNPDTDGDGRLDGYEFEHKLIY